MATDRPFHDDDEDPAAIRAAFDRGPHGFTSGSIDAHKDCRAALDAAQDENRTLREQIEAQGETLAATCREANDAIEDAQDRLYELLAATFDGEPPAPFCARCTSAVCVCGVGR